MADISIPKLNRLDANTVANTDVLLIVDDPQGNPENKKIQVGELFSGSQSERLPNDGLKVALASDEDKDNANDVVIIEATYSGLHNILLEDGGLLLIDSTDGSADAGDNIKLELQKLDFERTIKFRNRESYKSYLAKYEDQKRFSENVKSINKLKCGFNNIVIVICNSMSILF